MVPGIDFKLFAQPAPLIVAYLVANAVKERSSTQVEVSHEHAAEMAHVAHIVSRGSDRADELDRTKNDHEQAHGDSDGQGEEIHLAMRHDYRARQQDAVNGSGGADGRVTSHPQSVWVEHRAHGHVDRARADTTNEKIGGELLRSPHVFERRAKHNEI